MHLDTLIASSPAKSLHFLVMVVSHPVQLLNTLFNSGETEKVLKEISKLYESGLNEGPGSVGLRQMAESTQLGMVMRKPRKKVTVMIVGNHSAGKSSFINW